MKSRQGYKGYVIVARSCELREGEFSAEFSVEEHDADGVMETEFYLPDTFPTLWGLRFPTKEGWTEIAAERSERVGASAEVSDALRLMGLTLPVSPEAITHQYRALAMRWHPNRNPQDLSLIHI